MHEHIVPSRLREAHGVIFQLSDQLHSLEKDLVLNLHEYDRQQLYKAIGYNSLRGFLIRPCGFSRTQAQRITSKVRRFEPTVNSRVADLLPPPL